MGQGGSHSAGAGDVGQGRRHGHGDHDGNRGDGEAGERDGAGGECGRRLPGVGVWWPSKDLPPKEIEPNGKVDEDVYARAVIRER